MPKSVTTFQLSTFVFLDDEEEEAETATQKSPSRPGTNIHLWQFVKELLLQPSLYGNYIHWIDRAKGIFKIVDSVKVATLWGKRKVRLRPGKIWVLTECLFYQNRPAMNYDKLSRSLRQYYKKGIMKKTERSQRLVYQFCHPYHLWTFTVVNDAALLLSAGIMSWVRSTVIPPS